MGKRPKDAKVWNDDLRRALTCRVWHARHEQKQVQITTYERALNAIKETSKEIWLKPDGGVANLPPPAARVPNTAMQKIIAIVKGDEPIIPAGFEQFDTDGSEYEAPPVSQDHPYLRRMQVLLLIYYSQA